ncbi:exodeoxyribonuclease III [Endozoicomonadaceae bacterium StTr2]
MRVINFNAEGIRTAVEAGLFRWLEEQDADVICLQDTRETEDVMEQHFQLDGYFGYFFSGYERESVGGTALYTRHAPKAIIPGLGFPACDETGRYLQADFDKISIASLFVPGHEDNGLENKLRFLEGYSLHLQKQCRKRREFIMTGTWNIAHMKMDVANWREQQEEPGFTPMERAWMDGLFNNMGFTDAYREVDREGGNYSLWTDEAAREQNDGRRVDYQVVTPGMCHRVLNAGMYTGQRFSRHAPVIVDYDWELGFS